MKILIDERVIKSLILEYEAQRTYTECEEYRRQGAVTALERLLDIVGTADIESERKKSCNVD